MNVFWCTYNTHTLAMVAGHRAALYVNETKELTILLLLLHNPPRSFNSEPYALYVHVAIPILYTYTRIIYKYTRVHNVYTCTLMVVARVNIFYVIPLINSVIFRVFFPFLMLCSCCFFNFKTRKRLNNIDFTDSYYCA